MSINANFTHNPASPTYATNTGARPVSYSNYQTQGSGYGAPVVQTQGSVLRTDSAQSGYVQQPGQPGIMRGNSGSYAPQPAGQQVVYTNAHPVQPAPLVQTRTVVNQPQPVMVASDPRHTGQYQGEYHEEKKEGFCNASNACWGLLGLLGLAGLILGILFGVGVIGRSDTVIEALPASNNSTSSTTTTVPASSTTTTTVPSSSSSTTTTVPASSSTTTTTTPSSSSSSSTTTNTNTNTNTNTAPSSSTTSTTTTPSSSSSTSSTTTTTTTSTTPTTSTPVASTSTTVSTSAPIEVQPIVVKPITVSHRLRAAHHNF